MNKLLTLTLALVLSPLAALAGDSAWTTDAAVALARAKAENKVLLMDFTGSDWCIWCKRLDGEVFSQAEFKAYAEKNLVLLKLDFPSASRQSEAEKKQNQALAQKYGIEGYPTIIVLSADGRRSVNSATWKAGPRRGWPS